MPDITIAHLKPGDSVVPSYARLRSKMWDIDPATNEEEVRGQLEDQEHWAVFIACSESACVGFLEVWLREYAEGAHSSPVGYLEGWYVEPEHRYKGIGRMLTEAGETWARDRGCSEMASDAAIDNAGGIHAHQQLGYAEVDRIVCFLKPLL